MFVVSRPCLTALVVWCAMSGSAAADGPCSGSECSETAQPELPPAKSATPKFIPPLAAGIAWSVEVAGGASASTYDFAAAIGEEVAFGVYLASSVRTAWSIEVIEDGNLAIDRTTPQFGFIGFSGRHFARPEDPLIGAPGRTIDFHRLAVGMAFTYNGRQLASGVGAEASIAYMILGSHGVSVHLGGYFFDSSALSRDTLVMLSVGYVFSPVKYTPLLKRSPDASGSCGYFSAYKLALARARALAAGACDNETSPGCIRIRKHIRILNAGLNKCMLGIDVGPPEVPDGP